VSTIRTDQSIVEYWLSQQRQSYWCLSSLVIIIIIGLSGLYPDKIDFGQSTLYLEDLSYFWTHWLFPYFFFLVSLEARREILSSNGELHGRRAIAPAIMAVGGMIVPWLVFFTITGSGRPDNGALIPMATDIAFVVLAMTLGKASIKLRASLLALAIADDIGGIILMAVYGELHKYQLSFLWFLACFWRINSRKEFIRSGWLDKHSSGY